MIAHERGDLNEVKQVEKIRNWKQIGDSRARKRKNTHMKEVRLKLGQRRMFRYTNAMRSERAIILSIHCSLTL